MKYLFLLIPILFACKDQGPLVDNQQFVFTLRNGQSFSRVLPADWEPKYEGGFIRIDPNHRVMAMDLLLIQPYAPADVSGMRMVRLLRKAPPSQASSYVIWVPKGSAEIIGDEPPNDLKKVAPFTWIRPNEFRVQLDRDN